MLPINTSPRRLNILGCWLVLGALPSLVHGASLTLSDNLSEPTSFTETAQVQTWIGAPFRTTTAATLTSVSLLVANPSPGDAVLSLYAGTAQPETFVGNLISPAAYSTQLAPTAFAGPGLTLDAASSYWVVLRSLSGSFEWAFTESSTGAGAGFTPGWGVTDNGGTTWFTAQSEPMQMRVDAAAVPEPGSMALLGIGAGVLGIAFLVRRKAAVGTAAGSLLLATGMTVVAAPAVSVTKPRVGEAVHTAVVPIELRLDPAVNPATLEVLLNGRNVSTTFLRSGHCRPDGCPTTATVAEVDGLHQGQNTLWVRVAASSGKNGSWHTRFDWLPGVAPGQLPGDTSSLPPAVGFRTTGPGGGSASGGNWIQIYSNQGTGTTTTYPKGNACTTSYQVLALNRQTLAPKQDGGYTNGYQCFNDDASLTTALKNFTSADLVVVGNSWGQGVSPKLDTTPIGGTNYTAFSSDKYPVGYMIVGVGAATAGQAYESTNTVDIQSDSDRWPRANGLLAVDKDGNYTFHPSDYVEFKVRPQDATRSSSPSITIGLDTYTPPAGVNGFWLLVVDRRTLFSNPGCAGSAPNTFPNCGRFYETGDANTSTATQASVNLSNALNAAKPGELVFLVTKGTPAGYTGFPVSQLFDSINALGGSGYTLGRMHVASAYTLVSSNDTDFSKPLTDSAVVSTSLGETGPSGPNNGQTGFVKGVLGRDHNGLLRPLVASQETKDSIDTAQEADFSAYSIFWSQPGAWPYMDTPGRAAAYKWLSYQIVNEVLTDPTGNHLDDLRFYYPGSDAGDFANKGIDPTTDTRTATLPPDVVNNGWRDPVDKTVYTITEADRATVATQLKAELNALGVAINYFDGTSTGGGIRAALLDTSSFASAMFSAMAQVQSSLSTPTSTGVSVNLSKSLRLAGGIFALGRAINPAFGVISGLLNVASSVSAPKGFTGSTIPSAFAAYETTLSDFTGWSNDYRTELASGLATVIDNTYSDWAKLQAVSRNASNTDSAWYLRDQTKLATLSAPAAVGAKRHFYLQLLPKSYSVDYWSAQPVNTPQQIGSKYTVCTTTEGGTVCNTFCGKVYAKYSFPGWSWMNYPTPGQSTKTDLFVIGGSLNRNYSTAVTETFPSADLLSTMFNPQGDLKFPRDLFYSPNGPLSQRTGPLYTTAMCY